jgi:tetratricopeptide (TPR) repeat protein
VRAETRHSLKEDRFSRTTMEVAERTAHWTIEHKTKLIASLVIVLVVVAGVLGGWSYLNSQDQKASAELGQAVRTLDAQVRPSGTTGQPNLLSFASAQERSTAARKQLEPIINKYPHTATADIAQYFLGVTAADLGDNAAAERSLDIAGGTHNKDLAGLAKLALASLYRKEGKDSQAIDLYRQLIDKPTATVSKTTAQLELASLYETRQRNSEARKIYQQIQKDNPNTEAASLASAKLGDLK